MTKPKDHLIIITIIDVKYGISNPTYQRTIVHVKHGIKSERTVTYSIRKHNSDGNRKLNGLVYFLSGIYVYRFFYRDRLTKLFQELITHHKGTL